MKDLTDLTITNCTELNVKSIIKKIKVKCLPGANALSISADECKQRLKTFWSQPLKL